MGRKTTIRLHRMGIFTGKDLKNLSLKRLNDIFGKMGNLYYNFSRGIDNRIVDINSVRKSVGCECTFEKNLQDKSALTIELYHLVLDLIHRIEKAQFKGKTLNSKDKICRFSSDNTECNEFRCLRYEEQNSACSKETVI